MFSFIYSLQTYVSTANIFLRLVLLYWQLLLGYASLLIFSKLLCITSFDRERNSLIFTDDVGVWGDWIRLLKLCIRSRLATAKKKHSVGWSFILGLIISNNGWLISWHLYCKWFLVVCWSKLVQTLQISWGDFLF